MTLKDWATLFIATIGAVLGVLNTWVALSRTRVKLRVIPKAVEFPGGLRLADTDLCIEVINLSNFAVTITDMGFKIPGDKIRRASLPTPLLADGKPWPRRLESRETVVGYVSSKEFTPGDDKNWGRSFASTACGEIRQGRKFKHYARKKQLLVLGRSQALGPSPEV